MPPVTPSRTRAMRPLCPCEPSWPKPLWPRPHWTCPGARPRDTPEADIALQRACRFSAEYQAALRRRTGTRPGRRTLPGGLLLVGVLDLALGNFLEGHRQVVLRARVDERREELV